MAYFNGGIWAVGNGLASTLLVVYLALELGAQRTGLGVGAILAAPYLVGVLRLAAPAMIGRLADRKRFCIGGYALAAVALLAIPLVAVPRVLPSPEVSLWTLVGLWCVYHLMQYLATVALWSWLADAAPARVRGRFLGRRERWLVAGQVAAMLVAGSCDAFWGRALPLSHRWIPYAVLSVAGAGVMLAALIPLAKMPGVVAGAATRPPLTCRALLRPLTDPPFRRLLLFGCWFSFSNGLTQSAMNTFPALALGIGLWGMLALKTACQAGQFAVSPWYGRLADRLGNRRVMMVSLFVVAQGPFYYFLATSGQPWWLIVAWATWIAYAGMNVALPNLMLKLSPREADTPHIAMYYAVTGLFFAASVLAGGILQDALLVKAISATGRPNPDAFAGLFLIGWLLRLASLVVLWLTVREET